jgi:hypothetical protein
MSLAKINQIKRVRKPGTCGRCKLEIKVGDPAVRFAVGFRGYTQTRCTKTECFPKPSERESSLVADVYAAQEGADLSAAESSDDLAQIRDEVVEAARDIAEQYESSEMYDRNEDLQERAEMLNSAADELEQWEPDDEEPDEEFTEWTVDDTDYTDFEEARTAWLDAARQSLQSAIDEMELP